MKEKKVKQSNFKVTLKKKKSINLEEYGECMDLSLPEDEIFTNSFQFGYNEMN